MNEPWEPATSKPGEVFTPEGQIKMYGAAARGLTNRDPRLKPYRRQMWRTAGAIVGIGVALMALIAFVTSFF